MRLCTVQLQQTKNHMHKIHATHLHRRTIIKCMGMAIATSVLPVPLFSFVKHNEMKDMNSFDVIIIGGSYAGLSAAMALGRSLRKTLIIDGELPCNRFTPHAHNFLTHDGAEPGKIADLGRTQVLKYPTVQIHEDIATKAVKTEYGFRIHTRSGMELTCRKLLFATGLKDLLPDIKGFAECWGKSVIHCPYCHGYEFHHQPTGILANGNIAYHLAQLVDNLTKELYIFTNGKSTLTEQETETLRKRSISIIEHEVDYLDHQHGRIKTIVFNNQSAIDVNAVYARPDYEQHCKIPAQLGCELNEQGLLKVDIFQETTVKGVFAAGDNCAMRSIATAVYTGNIAGVVCNKELVEESF